jgi:hypothetical protein
LPLPLPLPLRDTLGLLFVARNPFELLQRGASTS